jgi:hypothetical protein
MRSAQLELAPVGDHTGGRTMTPSMLALAVIALLAAIIVLFARRMLHATETLDLGVVSTRWLSDLRRDDPQTGA